MESVLLSSCHMLWGNHLITGTVIASSSCYVALTINNGQDIGVWNLKVAVKKPLLLVGHHTNITAMSFVTSESASVNLLCSASSDNVILWYMEELEKMTENGQPLKGKVLVSGLGHVSYCCLNRNGSLVALCCARVVLVWSTQTRVNLGKFEDELGGTLLACLFGCYDTVVTVITDRTCKIWDWRTGCILNQMALDGGILSYVVGDEEGQHLISGSTNGILNVYQYNKEFASLKHGLVLDLWKLTREHQRKKLSFMCGRKSSCSIKPQEIGEVIEGHVEAGGCGGESTNFVLALHWITKQQSEISDECQSPIHYLERDDYLVAIATNTSLLIVDLKNHELLGFFDLREKLPVSDPSCASQTVGLLKTAALSVERKENITVYAVLVPLLGEEPWVVKMDLQLSHQDYLNNMFSSLDLNNCEGVDEEQLSFLSSKPPGSGSLLRSELRIKCSKKPQKFRFVSSKNSVLSHPVTFHSKVKSSGYTSTPRHLNQEIDSGWWVGLKSLELWKTRALPYPAAVSALSITGDGRYLACGLADSSVEILNSDQLNHVRTLTGHNGALTSVHFSHSGKWLVIGSADKSCSVWAWNHSEPLLSLGPSKIHQQGLVTGNNKKCQSTFPAEVHHAQFYYLDQFLLVGCRNVLYMYNYYLDRQKDDVFRYIHPSHSQLVASICIPYVKTVTAVGATNEFHSQLAVCATSIRGLSFIDMNTGQVVREENEIHSRPAHCISLNMGSPSTNQPTSAYNLFLTCAITDGIKLWDVRNRRCVKRLKDHPNTRLPCSASFSPCGTYIATGAENRAIYLYDIRGGHINKLGNYSDVILQVIYSPTNPQLVAATLDGTVYTHKPKEKT
ncbi:WD repeat-containing protein 27-like isoform X2 [Limulus polyphemus]|uniref:WD repeat-containing protein 27-like isoform X2 n=1 Tax=Limulus polyphemus TaxID=6850 RepID=A0ABM1TFA7_LIMPO|nr:WD repeat-containing protein 27-like isoform X2 [Limulus polyphemus]